MKWVVRLRSWHRVQVQFAGRLLHLNTSLNKHACLVCFRLGSKSYPGFPLLIVQHRWWGVERQYWHIVQKVGVASDTTYRRLFEEHANACVMRLDKRWIIPQSFKIVNVSVRVSAAHTFRNHFADLLLKNEISTHIPPFYIPQNWECGVKCEGVTGKIRLRTPNFSLSLFLSLSLSVRVFVCHMTAQTRAPHGYRTCIKASSN